MAGPGDEMSAGAADRGQFRASQLDRERVIEVLKDAFAQSRLDKDELDSRVGQALASRTYADLAALTADIPAGPAAAPPPRRPARAQNRAPRSRTARDVAIGLVVGLIIVTAIVFGGLLPYVALFGVLALPVAVILPVVLVATSLEQRRSRRQLPPRPGAGGHAVDGERYGETGHGPVPPGPRTDQTRADLRTDSSRSARLRSSGRGPRASHGIRPAPGAA